MASAIAGSNMLLLLVVLVVTLMIMPLFEGYAFGRALIYTGTSGVLIAGTYANRDRRRYFWLAAIVTALVLPVTWSTLLSNHIALFLTSCLVEAVFYAGIAGVILVAVIRKRMATVQAIFGAVSVYLLLGLAWAQLYWATERWERESLRYPSYILESRTNEGLADFSHVVYFSFVTMSSLGYGDIVPETRVAQTLAWMQAVVGQFYLAVLVAWVVSEIPRRDPAEGRRQRGRG
jgi:hypothetical protein